MLAWLLGNFANKENKGFYSIIIITMSAYYTSGADDGQNGQWKSRTVLELSIDTAKQFNDTSSCWSRKKITTVNWTYTSVMLLYKLLEWRFLN